MVFAVAKVKPSLVLEFLPNIKIYKCKGLETSKHEFDVSESFSFIKPNINKEFRLQEVQT